MSVDRNIYVGFYAEFAVPVVVTTRDKCGHQPADASGFCSVCGCDLASRMTDIETLAFEPYEIELPFTNVAIDMYRPNQSAAGVVYRMYPTDRLGREFGRTLDREDGATAFELPAADLREEFIVAYDWARIPAEVDFKLGVIQWFT